MAIPTAPTLATLVTEALSKVGQSSPDAALTTRAQDQWMEEIKNDIFLASVKAQKKLRSLYATSITIATVGVHRYSFPTDYMSDLIMTVLDGDTTGILQGGAVGSATLASTDTSTEAELVGRYILIISGTGKGSYSQITAYNETTYVATVSPNFETAPAISSGYRIITEYNYLSPTDVLQIEYLTNLTTSGKPTTYASIGDQDYGEFYFDFVPDATYGIQQHYYVDMSLTDLAGTRMATLYRKWRNVFIQGLVAKAFTELDDSRAKKAFETYYEYLNLLIEHESSGQDLGEMALQIKR